MCYLCDDEENQEIILAKASEPPDPRFPEIDRLVKAARRDWDRWGKDLVDAVMKAIGGGKNLPMDPVLEAKVYEILAQHELRLIVDWSGWIPGKGPVEGNIIPFPGPHKAPPLGVAWRVGRARDYFRVHLPATATPPLADVVKEAMAVRLTKQDRLALDYVARRGAILMRRPAQTATGNLMRTLTDLESKNIRSAIGATMARRASPNEVRQALMQSFTGSPSLQNDLDRIVRTEMHFAQAHGGYVALKTQAREAGEKDPWVYKLTSPRACADCRRIWGTDPKDPVKYRLSTLETNGDNFGRKAKEWRAVIGPVHPNCFPTGVLVATARGEIPIEKVEIGDLVWTHMGRWRPVTAIMRQTSDLLRLDGIPVTPGHPFLTPHGWVPAGQIKTGDHLFEPRQIVFPNAKNAPSKRFEVGFLSLVVFAFLRAGMPIPPINFYADHMGWQGQIQEVASDLVADFETDPFFVKGVEELYFKGGLELSRLRGSHALSDFLTFNASPDGGMGVRRIGSPPLDPKICVSEQGRLTAGTHYSHPDQVFTQGGTADSSIFSYLGDTLASLHSCLDCLPVEDGLASGVWGTPGGASDDQSFLDGGHRTPETFRNLRGALPGKVEGLNGLGVNVLPDSWHDVLRIVEVRHYSTTLRQDVVFNLSVFEDESYIAEGRVVHNCTEGPLLVWHESFVPRIRAAGVAFLDAQQEAA